MNGDGDWESRYRGKLSSFRVIELKDVLSQLGQSKQGRKQDLMGRILALLSHEEIPGMRGSAPRNHIQEQVARVIDDVHRKMDNRNGEDTELATEGLGGLDICSLQPNGEAEDSSNVDVLIFCPCGNSLPTDSMIQCVDPDCKVQQHIGCVILENSTESMLPFLPKFYCEACRVKRADPFWVHMIHLLSPMKLLVANADTNGMKPLLHLEKTFELTNDNRNLLRKAEYDVQAWCILLNDSVPFRMQWPQYSDLQVNGMPVRTVTRPGSQLLGANGRDDGALITLYIAEGFNKISLSACDDRVFCFGVRFVKRCTVKEVLNMIPEETDGELFEDALSRIRRCIGGGIATTNEDSDSDLEVIADSIPVNLRCPMSGSRMKVAGRFKPCAHMGCFDLETFVELNQRSRKWQCPICLKNYSLEDIIIDPYFNRITTMMRNCDEEITEILVKPDGSWSARTKGDLARWHFPDGTLCVTAELPEGSEGHDNFKVGLNKNHNRISEASKHKHMTLSTRNQLEETYDQEIITMSSSASEDDDSPSSNQDYSGRIVISTNSNEFNSIPYPIHGIGKTSHAPLGDADIVILSDSDEENVNIDSSEIVHTTFPINGGPASHGIQDIDMKNQTLDGVVSSCLGLFNDKGVSKWPYQDGNQAGSGLQLFGIHPDVTNAFIDLEHTSGICSEPINGYRSTPESSKTCGGQVLESSACDRNNDLHDGLVDNPFVGEDRSVQNFLLNQPPSLSIHSRVDHQSPVSNGIYASDWISLRLGRDGVNSGDMGTNTGSASTNRLDSRHNSGSNEAKYNEEGSSSKRTDTRKLSGGPFSFPRQLRSVRRRVFHS